MLTQRDFKLIEALYGLHSYRHLLLSLYLLATAIILIWLLGLGGTFSVTVGPYLFSTIDNGVMYWLACPWMHAPIAAMAGWEAPTQSISIYGGAALWPLWLRLCINVMLLLPFTAVLAVSLARFVREFVRAVSGPSMVPPTLSRDAALAVAFGPSLCLVAHLVIILSLEALHEIAHVLAQSQCCPYFHACMRVSHELYLHVPPLLHWPIWSIIAFVMLRVFATSRRGVLRPLHGLCRMMLFSSSLVTFVMYVFLPGFGGRHHYPSLGPEVAFFLFLCLTPLYWSLGAVIAVLYHWPRLSQIIMSSYCIRCRYDMRGSYAAGHRECPECGHLNTPPSDLPPIIST